MQITTLPLLSFLIWFPILCGSILLIYPERNEQNYPERNAHTISRVFSLIVAIICFIVSCLLLNGFNSNSFEMQWTEHLPWIPTYGINYFLGIDGFSLPLIILTCFMTILVVLGSFSSVSKKVPGYLACFLIMQGLVCGAFAALDAILFYVFWEGMLIPMFLIIGIWGAENRIYATIKFFLYTFLGSVLLLVGIIYLHFQAQASGITLQDSFSILSFHTMPISFTAQKWLFIGFLIAFAVKIPMWPVHTWLPDAHVEAPTGGSVILAAILLKMGGYGFLRFLLPITPDASQTFAVPMITLSLIAIVYIALVAIVQKDMKKLIAYSSISHMGFVTLGIFVVCIVGKETMTQDPGLGISGAMFQMISHGFVSAALFLCVGVLYDRLHSRLIHDFGGVVNTMPVYASFFMLFAMANVGLPGTSGFVGEFMVIMAAFQAKLIYAILAATILVFGASYTLWMYKRVAFGPIKRTMISTLSDLNGYEKWILSLLAAAVIILGLWPAPLLNVIQGSTTHLVEQVGKSKI